MLLTKIENTFFVPINESFWSGDGPINVLPICVPIHIWLILIYNY